MAKRTDFKPTEEQRRYRSDPMTLAKEKDAATVKEVVETKKEPEKK